MQAELLRILTFFINCDLGAVANMAIDLDDMCQSCKITGFFSSHFAEVSIFCILKKLLFFDFFFFFPLFNQKVE